MTVQRKWVWINLGVKRDTRQRTLSKSEVEERCSGIWHCIAFQSSCMHWSMTPVKSIVHISANHKLSSFGMFSIAISGRSELSETSVIYSVLPCKNELISATCMSSIDARWIFFCWQVILKDVGSRVDSACWWCLIIAAWTWMFSTSTVHIEAESKNHWCTVSFSSWYHSPSSLKQAAN